MPSERRVEVSAQVVLRARSGASPRSEDLTAEKIGSAVPPPDVVARATRFFAERGFQVGPCVGISFAITGPEELFGRFFGTTLERSATRGVRVRDGGAAGYELPLDGLPEAIAPFVEAVTFTPPPDFGPVGSHF